MRWRSVVAVTCIVAACTVASTPAHAASPLNARDADADVVLVLPALDHKTLNAERHNLHRFVHALHKQHLRVAFVPLSKVLGTRSPHSLTAEDVRLYLRSHFTWRPSTTERPRYLGVLASPDSTYLSGHSVVPSIPRFHVFVAGSQAPFGFDTDVPYEFLPPATIDGGDGSVDPHDLNAASPTFDVFRVPINAPRDLRTLGRRHDAFARAPYRNDATLVAGLFGLFGIPGDTSIIQCLNASDLTTQHLATRILKVFDSTEASCPPDLLTAPGGPNLADLLTAPPPFFRGGTIVNISHGDAAAIYGHTSSGEFFPNLSVGDVARIPRDRLNVFISIACDNDGPGVGPNLAAAMFTHASVAVISATTTTVPLDLASILFAEHDSVVALFQHHENVLQALHAFRSEYYQRFAATNAVQWTNLLTVNLIGDGFAVVAR